MRFQIAVVERREAFADYNAAGLKLENRQMKERAAELESQSLVSIGFGEIADREREVGLMFVRYVVGGRKPIEQAGVTNDRTP